MSQSSDVILVSLGSQRPTESWFVGESMGICYLAAALRAAGIKTTLIDFGLILAPKASWVPIVNLKKPKIVGISVNQVTYSGAKDFINGLRTSGFDGQIFMGGHHATLYAKQIVKECSGLDAVVIGEAENSFKEIVTLALAGQDWMNHTALVHRENKDVAQVAWCNTPEINDILFPARDFLPTVLKRGGRTAVLTSRGCYASCSFCTIHEFYRSSSGQKLGWRGRTAASLVEEISQLKKDYGVEFFTFTDDTFMGPGKIGRQRLFEFANELEAKRLGIQFIILARANEIDRESVMKLKEVGLQQILIGIESFDDKDLRFYRKGTTPAINKRALDILSELGVRYDMGMIMFHPKSHLESVEESYLNFKNYFSKNGGVFTSALNITSKLIIREKTKITNNLVPVDSEDADFDGTYAFSDKKVACLAESMGLLFQTWLMPILSKKKFLEEASPESSQSFSLQTEQTVASCIFDLFDQVLPHAKSGIIEKNIILEEIDLSRISNNLQALESSLDARIKELGPQQAIDLFVFNGEDEFIVVPKNDPNYFKVDRVVAEYLLKKTSDLSDDVVHEVDNWLAILAKHQTKRLLETHVPKKASSRFKS